ncbi:MAG: hypothetical protein M3Y49_19410 [Actinomycetota bacterium]|nr:hypothetical protein [Actinomycetota bacterium]
MSPHLLVAMVVLIIAISIIAMVLAFVVRGPTAFNRGVVARPHLRRLGWTTRTLQRLAVPVGIALVAAMSSLGGLGRGIMMVPVIFGATQILAVVVANVVTRSSARTPGVAALEIRRVRDLIPQALSWATGGAVVVLAGLLTWTTAVASADDQGRAGRSFKYACSDGCKASFGPWPGSYYSVPLGIAVVLVLAFAGLALWQTARRPRNGADAQIAIVDDAIRRGAARSVVAGACIAVCGSLVGIASEVGIPLIGTRLGGAFTVIAWATIAALLLSLVTSIWALVVLLGARPIGRKSAATETAESWVKGAA